jgi:hypothetical protein
MDEVSWGIPKQRTAKVEKFDTPVVTMSAIDKGSGRKFSFNKAAQELLGLVGGESHVKIGFGGDSMYIQSQDAEGEGTFPMTKGCTFSNKRIYEYIVKRSTLDSSEDNFLHLATVEGQPYVTVSHASTDATLVAVEGNTLDEVTVIDETLPTMDDSSGPGLDLGTSVRLEEEWN